MMKKIYEKKTWTTRRHLPKIKYTYSDVNMTFNKKTAWSTTDERV